MSVWKEIKKAVNSDLTTPLNLANLINHIDLVGDNYIGAGDISLSTSLAKTEDLYYHAIASAVIGSDGLSNQEKSNTFGYIWLCKTANCPYNGFNSIDDVINSNDIIVALESSNVAQNAINNAGTNVLRTVCGSPFCNMKIWEKFISWTQRTSGLSTNIFGVTYGNGLFVAVGYGGMITTSTDGITWTKCTSGFGTTNIFGVTYGNGLFVAVGGSGTSTSTNGINWTPYSGTMASTTYGVTYGDGLFVAVGKSGKIATSTNGTSWVQRTSGISTDINAVTYGNGLFVAGGERNVIITSPDGITWTKRTSGFTSSTTDIKGLTYGNGLFVAVGSADELVTSPNGVAWTKRTYIASSYILYNVTYGNGLFVAVGSGGVIITSLNGINWTQRYTGLSKYIYGTTYGNGLFVAVGDNGVVMTSV